MFSERRNTILERMGVMRWQMRAQAKAIGDKLVLGEDNNHWEKLVHHLSIGTVLLTVLVLTDF